MTLGSSVTTQAAVFRTEVGVVRIGKDRTVAPYWHLAFVLLAACKAGPKHQTERATSNVVHVAMPSTLVTSTSIAGLTEAPAESGAPTTTDVIDTSVTASQNQRPLIDMTLLRRADAVFAFVERWSEALRKSADGANEHNGYAVPEVAAFYDTAAFTYVRQSENKTSERWHWPLVESLPELARLTTHRTYLPQLLHGELPRQNTPVQIQFIEERHVFVRAGDRALATRGLTVMTLSPRSDGFVIAQELEYPRTPAITSEPEAEVVNWTSAGRAEAIIVAERACTKTTRGCPVPGVLVLVKADQHSLIFHATEPLASLGRGQFVDDPERLYLESSNDGTYYGFSFSRRAQTLEIDTGWANAEDHRRVNNWEPLARIGLNTSEPIPLLCVALHESQPSVRPCHVNKPTL